MNSLGGRTKGTFGLAWGALLWCSVVLIAAVVVHIGSTADACILYGDYPLLALSVEKARRFTLLVGPYSRHHFFHPSPLLFYYYALADSVGTFFPPGYPRFAFAQALLNFLFVVITVRLITRFYGSELMGWVTAGLLFWIFPKATPLFFADIWGPTTLLCPMVVFLLCAAILFTGAWEVLSVMALAACVMAANHIGALVIILPIGSVSLLRALYIRRKKKSALTFREWWSLALSVFVFGLTVVPPFVEMCIDRDGGNVGAIVQFFLHGAARHSFIESLQYSAASFVAPIELIFGATGVNPVLCMLVFLLLPFLFPLSKGSYIYILRVMLPIAQLFSLYAAMHIKGAFHPFILRYEYALVVLALFLFLECLRQLLIKKWKGSQSTLPQYTHRFRAAVLILLCAAVVFYQLKSPSFESCPTPNRYDRMITALGLAKGRVYKIRARKHGEVKWDQLAMATLSLYRAGYQPCIEKRWEFMFGSDLRCASRLSKYPIGGEIELVAANIAAPEELSHGIAVDTLLASVHPFSNGH